jgi:hypothetical protein
MDKVKTFEEILNESIHSLTEDELLTALNESYKQELTEEEEARVDEAIKKFVNEYLNSGKTIDDLQTEIMNEGLIGSIIGGLTGFALGKSIGKIIANVLGIEKGVFYELLTSRLVGAALGAALGKRV